MLFQQIIIEKNLTNPENPSFQRAQNILKKFSTLPVYEVENYQDVFGKFHKPYLEKRNHLWLILAEKKGLMIKPAPDAYGTATGEHYYFVHAYNCIYECQYCYLQGYFQSPDIVLFLNYHEILEQMEHLILSKNGGEVWFHAGEFSDSLALNDYTQEIPLLHGLFQKHPNAFLELRTKSVNIKTLMNLPPLKNFIVSFSLSSESQTREMDLKTPPLKHKLKALRDLLAHGHSVGLHFDPMVFSTNFQEEYQDLVNQIAELFSHAPGNKNEDLWSQLHYISLGVVRFTKTVFMETQKNYPQSKIFHQHMSRGFDQKVRYPRPFRFWMMNTVKSMLLSKNPELHSKIYFCMEENEATLPVE
jgi:spore photoproduct lyase